MANASFPPLPDVPEPPIFDAPYVPKFLVMFNDSSFPANMSAEAIYQVRRRFVEAILASRNESSRSLSIALLVAWLSMVLLCAWLLVRIRHNRERALRGDQLAAHKIVLPAFEPLLWTLGGVNLGLILAYGALLVANDFVVYHDRVAMEGAVAVKQVNGLLVVLYMLQPSLSLRALRSAMCLAILLAGYTIPIVMALNAVATQENQLLCYWTLLASRCILVIYLINLIACPPARASVRSFRLLCLYTIILIAMMSSMTEVYHRGAADLARVVGWVIAIYSMILPLCIWHVLRADTEHWRGIGKRAVELQHTFRRKKGKIHERVSSQGLHVLIEMHRKYIIDFARLQFYEPLEDVGGGKTKATVYRGFLHTMKTAVAIKVFMPRSFTEETVAAFSHEAALCGSLVHPNIVKFHGLCVCPPNICLVTELCQGSLQEAIQTQASRPCQTLNLPSRRQQTAISIGYMIDAARALAYLHSFSPPFVHRDIKPSSFLIDENGTVKLTDFGASRTLSARETSGRPLSREINPAGSIALDVREQDTAGQMMSEVSHRIDASRLFEHAAEYMAPEVIIANHDGSSMYDEAADVFALGMMMWDIFHPGRAKYLLGFSFTSQQKSSIRRINPHQQREAEIFELVMAGHRPHVGSHVATGLKELMEATWQADPSSRPTAQSVVKMLETIQQELCAAVALELHDNRSVAGLTTSPAFQETSFAGADAVAKLCILGLVDTPSEAIRLGNLLMDCGFMHHTRHARGFENGSAQYVFDHFTIGLHQPVAILEAYPVADGTPPAGVTFGEAGEAAKRHHHQLRCDQQPAERLGRSDRGQERSSSLSSHSLMENQCACRVLAQGFETERSRRRRLRFRFKMFSDENLLTANLLSDDLHLAAGKGCSAFEALREPTDRRAKRLGSAPCDAK